MTTSVNWNIVSNIEETAIRDAVRGWTGICECAADIVNTPVAVQKSIRDARAHISFFSVATHQGSDEKFQVQPRSRPAYKTFRASPRPFTKFNVIRRPFQSLLNVLICL